MKELLLILTKNTTMKRLLLILLCLPMIGFAQTQNINVNVKKTPSFSESFNEGMKAGAAAKTARAAQTAAAAEAEKARIARAEAMSASNIDIKTPLEVDLNNYTHIALINVIFCDNLGTQSSDKKTYTIMENSLSDSPLIILNPYKENRRKFKKDKKFLRDTKSPQWLYFYYTKSIQGVDEIRRVVVRDSENKTLFNVTTRNTPFDQTVEPFVFF